MSATYRVQLAVVLESVAGHPPAWQRVADALVLHVAGATLEVGRSKVLADECYLDTAPEPDAG